MYRLSMRNFQSIAEQDFDFKGFVALTGPSNLGKSAVRRALGAVLYNDWQPNFQRNHSHKNPPNTKLVFEKEGHYKITQVKPDNSYTIEVQGQDPIHFGKVGRTVPEEIQQLGFRILEVNDSFLNLNVTKQTDQLFMVSYVNSTNTGILNKLFNLSQLEAASGMATRDRKKEQQEQNRQKEYYDEAELTIRQTEEQLASVTSQHDALKAILDQVTILDAYVKASEDLSGATSSLDSTTTQVTTYRSFRGQLESLGKLQDYIDTKADLATLSLRYKTSESDVKAYSLGVTLLKRVSVLDQYTEESSVLAGFVDKLSTFQGKLDVLQTAKSTLNKVTLADGYLAASSDLSGITPAVEAIQTQVTSLKEMDKIRPLLNLYFSEALLVKVGALLASTTSQIEELKGLRPLFDNVALLGSYFELQSQVSSFDDKISMTVANIAATREEMNQFPRCGECNQLLLDHEGAH